MAAGPVLARKSSLADEAGGGAVGPSSVVQLPS
jgi:hypothetical protein